MNVDYMLLVYARILYCITSILYQVRHCITCYHMILYHVILHVARILGQAPPRRRAALRAGLCAAKTSIQLNSTRQ